MNKVIPVAVCVLLMLFCVPALASDTSGAISVISSPNGADVYVEDRFVGVASDAFPNIPTGERMVRVVKAGYFEYNTTVHVGSSHSASMTVNLQKTQDLGGLVVDSNPQGASVYLNGEFKGITHSGGGLQIAEIPPGEYTIRLELDGYKPYTVSDYMIPAGEATYLTNVRLNKIATETQTPTPTRPSGSATILLDATPEGSAVYLNNVFSGYTPVKLDHLEAGSYRVLISSEGYANWESVLTVQTGDLIQQTAVLTKTYAPPAPTKSPFGLGAVFAGLCVAVGAVLVMRK